MAREESMRRLSASLIGAGLALAVSTAQAAGPGFCRDYANAALNQVRAALSLPGCRGGMGGSRWSADFPTHYSWCLGAPPAAAEEERAARTVHLRRCRGY
jgi:hypothetical protein